MNITMKTIYIFLLIASAIMILAVAVRDYYKRKNQVDKVYAISSLQYEQYTKEAHDSEKDNSLVSQKEKNTLKLILLGGTQLGEDNLEINDNIFEGGECHVSRQ